MPIVRNRPCWDRESRGGRKRWQKKKDETREKRNCTVAGLDYTVTLASSMVNALPLAGRRLLFSFSLFLSLPLSFLRMSIRDGQRNRTKRTSPIAPQRLPHHVPHLHGFLCSLPLFYSSTSCSSRPSLLPSREFTRPLRLRSTLGSETSPWTVLARELLGNLGPYRSLSTPIKILMFQ